jgi:hypothetical protein
MVRSLRSPVYLPTSRKATQVQLDSAWVRRVHPRRDVALPVKHTPDIDVIVALDAEDKMRIARQWPEPQTGKVQLVSVAGEPVVG